MKRHEFPRYIAMITAILILTCAGTAAGPAQAEANYFNDLYRGLERFSELPSEVQKLQESYKETVDELEQTKDQLNRTMESMEAYRQQNAALTEQNRQLTQVVDELRDERTARERYVHRLKVTLFTGLGLLAGYFILVRAIRFGMRSRSRRGDRPR